MDVREFNGRRLYTGLAFCGPENCHPYSFYYGFYKCGPISIIFGTRYIELICNTTIVDLPTSHGMKQGDSFFGPQCRFTLWAPRGPTSASRPISAVAPVLLCILGTPKI